LNNEVLFNWLDKYCPPQEWLIEVSGGEPGLYPDIEDLIHGLNERGYYGLIRTNGILPIPKAKNFHRVAGWHKTEESNQKPEYFDSILITKNPDDDWNEKVNYCLENEIPYKLVQYKHFGVSTDEREQELSEAQSETKPLELVKNWTVIYSSGRQAFCFQKLGEDEDTIQNMVPPLLMDMTTDVCLYCDSVVSFEMCLPDELKARIISAQ
jgi:organic radical activating enzyme